MFNLCLSFVILTISPFKANAIFDLDIIESYFNERSVTYATVFGCFNKSEHFNLYKDLTMKSELISILNINQNNFEKNLKNTDGQIAVIADGDCPGIQDFFIKCGHNKFFDVKHHWLILSSSPEILETFEKVNLNINADIHVAISDNNQNWSITDVYNPAAERGGKLNATEIGFYSKEFGYKARLQEAKYWVRKNMSGVTFKTMIVLPVPFKGSLENYLASDADPDINTFNRFHCRLVHFCKTYYNFSMQIESNDSWGYTNPDGTFDGQVGGLEKKTLDFGCSPLFVRTDRATVIDYGRLTWILRAAFIFRNTKAQTSFEIFLKPFSTSIWVIILVIGICASAFLKIVTTFERKKYHYKIETSWSLSAILTLGAFCQQSFPKTPKMTCGRIVTIAIFLLSIIVYQFYSASIVSNLLMNPVTAIKSLADLINSPIAAGCEDTLYTKDFFKHSPDHEIQTLYAKKIAVGPINSSYLPPEVGLERVEKGGYAFHVEVATAYPIIGSTFREKSICELREVQLFRTQPMHANYQKHSPFRDMLDTCLQRLAEHGIIFRERKFWHPRKPECITSLRSDDIKVGLTEFYPALVTLLIGIGISLIVLGVEIYIRHDGGKPSAILVDQRKVFPFVK